MLKKTVAGIMFTLLFVGMLTLAFNIQPATASLPVHNIDTGLDYATIQEAINANETLDGHTIIVDAGVYYENVVLNKTLSLVGENRDFTVIDANGTGNGIVIQADYSMVENFTIQNGGFGIAIMGNSTKRYVGNVVVGNIFRNNADAIGLSTCDRNVIANNTFENDGFNIIVGWINPFASWDVTSNYNTITRNNMTQGFAGILILYSKHNVVSENTISNMTDTGITFVSGGDYPYVPIVTNNSLCNNVIVNCTSGLILYSGSGSCNNITGNVIQHNEMGLCISEQSNNTIMDNTIANNVFGMYLTSKNNLLRANVMFENVYNLVETTYVPPTPLYNDIDTSNTVNGKSIYYFFNQTNLNINPSAYPDMGFLALKNCSNVIIENMTFTNNGFGISLDNCANVTIEKTTTQDNFVAISALSSVNIKIRNSVVQNNLHGLTLIAVDPPSEISNNLILNNTIRNLLAVVTPYFAQTMHLVIQRLRESLLYTSGGIYIRGMTNSTVSDNVIMNNERGIYLEISIHNAFKNNTMINNVYNFGVDPTQLIPREWVIFPPDPPQISPHLMNDIDTSNTVDGKPIYWWINRHNEQVPTDAGNLVLGNSTNMIIKDLALQNNSQGMVLVGVSNSLISNNVITNTQHGIYIRPHTNVNPSTNNEFMQNNITRNGMGIFAYSNCSVISHNLVMNNLIGVYAYDNVVITQNRIANSVNPPLNEWIFGYPLHAYGWPWYFYGNGVGMVLEGTNTTVKGNTIQDNYYGISVGYVNRKGDNKIYHNNFINNTQHIWRGFPPYPVPNNTWDNGYPSGGNYWSNYTGVDLYSGSIQDETGSDGIGDDAYVIDENNQDQFPLMAPFCTFNAGTWDNKEYNVDVISNSTASEFHFDPNKGAFLRFNVTGQDGTAGFCRVTVPKDLLWAEDGWTVLVGDQQITGYKMITYENCTYLYFNYNHSRKTVTIQGTHVIPEFSSAMILPLSMLTTLIATVLLKKKRKPKSTPLFCQ